MLRAILEGIGVLLDPSEIRRRPTTGEREDT